MTKPANFPARKAQRQREAAERRIPQIAARSAEYKSQPHIARELEAVTAHNAMLVMPFREVKTKKIRGVRSF